MRIDLTRLTLVAEEIRDLCGEDEQTFMDTLDGETDIFDVLDALIEEMQDASALAAAAKDRANELRARADRMERRADARKRAMHLLMDAAGISKAERPAATLSLRAGRERVEISDSEEIPTQLCRFTREPDRGEILRRLKAGEAVPGATLARGPETLMVRGS